MANEERVQGGSGGEGEIDPPFSRAEQLIQAHPDITIIRDMTGHIRITQTFPAAEKIHDRLKWRHMWVNVEHEEGSQRHYPSVILTSFDYPRHRDINDDRVWFIRSHGLKTIVKVHVEDDEQVTTEVGYNKRLRYPRDFKALDIRYVENYSVPIPAQELVTTARTGLEMLKAYGEATREQRARIDNLHIGYHGWSQIVDTTRPDLDAYIAEASPLLGDFMKRKGISYTHVGTKSIYALNALNKVTDAMLPSEMPPAPQNRKEPARRTRPPGR